MNLAVFRLFQMVFPLLFRIFDGMRAFMCYSIRCVLKLHCCWYFVVWTFCFSFAFIKRSHTFGQLHLFVFSHPFSSKQFQCSESDFFFNRVRIKIKHTMRNDTMNKWQAIWFGHNMQQVDRVVVIMFNRQIVFIARCSSSM